jgi:hypothetical protein
LSRTTALCRIPPAGQTTKYSASTWANFGGVRASKLNYRRI